MKLRVVLPILLLVFILSSCTLPGGKPAEPTAAPTLPPPPTAEPVQPPQQAEPPTAEPVVVTEAAPVVATEAVPVVAEEPASSASFNEEFDLANEDWSKDYWVTTQAPQYRELTKPSMVVDGILSFNIVDSETYIYKFHNGDAGQDVTVETKFINKGQPNNGVALVCRAAPDYSSWFEARVSAQGKWSITRYDKSLKENEDKNPYVSLKEGVMRPKLVTPMKANKVQFACIGTKLTLTVNGEEVATRNTNELMQSGMVGLGIMSYNNLPVMIEFDYFTLTASE